MIEISCKELSYENMEKVIDYLNLSNEKISWIYKGETELEEVTITENCEFIDLARILKGSKFNDMLIVKEGKAIDDESPLYCNIYKYIDKRKVYNEIGEEIHINRSCDSKIGWHDKNLYIFAIYANYNNNERTSYNIEYYYIK